MKKRRGTRVNRFIERPESFSQWCLFLLRFFFLLVFSALFLGVCCFNNASRFVYNMPLAVVLSAGLFFFLMFAAYRIKKAAPRLHSLKRLLLRHPVAFFLCCTALLFALQFRFDYALYHPVGWDVSAIVQGAQDLSSLHLNDYFSWFPNNLLLVYLIHGLLQVYKYFGGQNVWLYLAVVNTALVDTAAVFVFFIGRKLWGVSAGFFSFGIFILLFGFSPWILVPYSDTFSMWIPASVLLFFLCARDAKHLPVRLTLYFFAGLLSMAGFFLKPFTLMITAAILLIGFIQSLQSVKRFSAFLLAGTMLAAGCGCALALDRTLVADCFSGQIDSAKGIPFTHFLMMGLNIQVSGATGRELYGAYNAEDYRITLQQQTKQEKIARNLQVIQERLQAFGPAGYAEFLVKKADWIFSDGVFWVEGEGDDVDTLSVASDPVSCIIQSFFRFYGWNFHWYSDIAQAIWILTLFFIICPLFLRKDDYKDTVVMICRISLLGLLFYLLLSEARSRYLISFLPIASVLAGYGFSLFLRNLDGNTRSPEVKLKKSIPASAWTDTSEKS